MNTQETWPGDFDDDRPGMMRVHIGQRRGRILADHLTRDELRDLARTLGAPTGYRLKSDLATAVAFAGASDPRPATAGGVVSRCRAGGDGGMSGDGLTGWEYDVLRDEIVVMVEAERDRARATAVTLAAELLALKELAAEMCSAYRGFLAQVVPEPLGHWVRLDNSASALEQAVWGDRR